MLLGGEEVCRVTSRTIYSRNVLSMGLFLTALGGSLIVHEEAVLVVVVVLLAMVLTDRFCLIRNLSLKELLVAKHSLFHGRLHGFDRRIAVTSTEILLKPASGRCVRGPKGA